MDPFADCPIASIEASFPRSASSAGRLGATVPAAGCSRRDKALGLGPNVKPR
jgi:hypothetical protein